MTMISAKLPKIFYGGDYNPEQWPEAVWAEDVKLMREAGVNLVSVGIFSWARLQPNERTYDWGWFDRVLDLLAANGILACVATATASPPAWMSTKYPDVLAVDAEGKPYYPGARQHYSPCSPTYRRLAAALVTRMAKRYAKHPALAAWHINNEYGCHMSECHGEASTRAWRGWLKNRYGTLEALNAAWGTAFWSQHYYSWEEILTPRRAPYHPNPTQQVDFKRFMSDAFLELCTMERDILRAATPEVPITTNFMGFFKPLDHWRWAREIDFTAWDSYPDPATGHAAEAAAACGHDLTRSLKKERPFVLMEQVTSQVNWRPTNLLKRPGVMRLWSLQAVARGADGVMFFQWRASQGGAEKFHGAMVPHGGTAESRVWREVKALGADLARLEPVVGSRIQARVAITVDWNAWWGVELDSRPGRINYAATVAEFHRYFFERNIAVDFVHPGADLGDYDLVVAPALYLLAKNDAVNLEKFVARGGVLFTTYFSGVADENDRIVLGGYPGYLRRVLGLWVEEWSPMMEGETNRVRFAKTTAKDGVKGPTRVATCSHWCEVVHLEGARALATFAEDFFAGGPALTANAFGQGAAYYLATKLDAPELARVLDGVCARAKVGPVMASVPKDVEVSLRERDGARFLFLMNHGAKAARVRLAGVGAGAGAKFAGVDLLTGERVGRAVTVAALGVRVIEVGT
ncbi:MAG: beta-galactosidase [Verrucomicrobia bacterium]|nr:beta-galactosidase [Verrucomicrobiota bacterium]